MTQVTVWTLTVDDGNGIWVTAYPTEDDAYTALADNYDADGELQAMAGGDVLKGISEYGGLKYVDIDSHTIDLNRS